MKTSFTRQIRTTVLACSLSVAGVGLQAQDLGLDIGTPDPSSIIDSGAEQIRLMPYQNTPVEVGAKERNPFAVRTPEKKVNVEELENKEEDRIRVILSELPIAGVSRGILVALNNGSGNRRNGRLPTNVDSYALKRLEKQCWPLQIPVSI